MTDAYAVKGVFELSAKAKEILEDKSDKMNES